MKKLKLLPHNFFELAPLLGLFHYHQWSESSIQEVFGAYDKIKSLEKQDRWILPEIEEIVKKIAAIENYFIEKAYDAPTNYAYILEETDCSNLIEISEFWQIPLLKKYKPDVFKGAQRFFTKIKCPTPHNDIKDQQKRKLITILENSEKDFSEHRPRPKDLSYKLISPGRLLNTLKNNFESVTSTKPLFSTNKKKIKPEARIGLGLDPTYKRNNLPRSVKTDMHTAPSQKLSPHHLYTAGWSSNGTFTDDVEK